MPDKTPSPPPIEYWIEDMAVQSVADMTAALNALGVKGWQLEFVANYVPGQTVRVIFSRPLKAASGDAGS